MNTTLQPFTKMLVDYSTSVFEKNIEHYVNLYTDDILIFDMWNDWYVQGLTQWREIAESWFASISAEKVIVTATEIQSNQYGDIIIGCAIIKYAAVNAEGIELRYLNNRISISMRDIDGRWKIFHQHSSAPIDSKSIQVKFHLDNS